MITIDQLLESVDLDFEPRFVTKDEDGEVWIWNIRPGKNANWRLRTGTPKQFHGRFISERLKLAEFENKPWQECIYEVPRKTTGKIEKLDIIKDTRDVIDKDDIIRKVANFTTVEKINELIDAVNELKGAKNE